MIKRYRVTTIIEELTDPDRYTNPESGKVESYALKNSAGEVTGHSVPPWEEVARFGSGTGVDAETLEAALPGLFAKINETYEKVVQFAPMADRDTLIDQGKQV